MRGKTKETQTEVGDQYVAMMKLAEKMWEDCLDTATRMKFEALRSRHHYELQELM